MLTRFAFCLICGFALCAAAPLARAQDEQPADPPATAPPATEAKPDAAAEDAPAADKGPAAKKFDETYGAWKEILKQLREVRTKYQTADEAETVALKTQWDELIAQADAMLPALRADAMAAYEEAPNLDSTITRFLVKLLADDVARDDYQAGAKLADVLIKNGCDFKQIYNHAGVIAFVTNDYDNAEKYLNMAGEANALDETGTGYLSLIPEYRKLWEREQKLREAEAAADDLPRVKLATSKGDIIIELFENEAPQTVGNFVNLVEQGFYNDKIFHRVLPNFMAQGGDPKGDGTGGPGYNIYCECYEKDRRDHFQGTLSMAHAGRDTGGSQFFLTFVPTPHLNGRHTAFGRVIEGMDVLSKLQRIDPSNPATAATPDKIVTAEVVRKRDHEYVPTKVK
jgi:cyclophilin family peptidyl-prolyl cis-trans isomerase